MILDDVPCDSWTTLQFQENSISKKIHRIRGTLFNFFFFLIV